MFNFKGIVQMLENMKTEEFGNIPKLPKHEKYKELINEYIEGELGEYVSINQYIYESSKFSNIPEIRRMFDIIVAQKIKHLEIFNSIYMKLGGESKLKDNVGKEIFEKYNVYESKDFRIALKYNVEFLNKKIEKYNELVEITNISELKEIYKHIIKNEETVKSILRMM